MHHHSPTIYEYNKGQSKAWSTVKASGVNHSHELAESESYREHILLRTKIPIHSGERMFPCESSKEQNFQGAN